MNRKICVARLRAPHYSGWFGRQCRKPWITVPERRALKPTAAHRPAHVYAGIEAAALFRSTDGGQMLGELPDLRGYFMTAPH